MMLNMTQTRLIATAAIMLMSTPAGAADGEKVDGGTLCTETPSFALCTSAPCRADPNDSKTLVCDCAVASGPNWGKTSCQDRIGEGAELISNFSPIQMGPPLNYSSLVCGNKIAWASCLDAPCTINSDDATKATCRCPISTQAPWFTFGGGCHPTACEDTWSAAAADQDMSAIYKAFADLGVPGADAPQCAAQ